MPERVRIILSGKRPGPAFCLVVGALVCCFAATPSSAQTGVDAVKAILSTTDNTQPPQDVLDRLRAARALLDGLVTEDPGSDLALAILRRESVDGLDIIALDDRIGGLSADLHRQRLAAARADLAAVRSAEQAIQPSPSATIPLPGDPAAGTEVSPSEYADAPASLDMNELVAGLQAAGSAPTVPVPKPVPVPDPVAQPAVPDDPKELMRLTQENLNRVGCKVGSADGVAGSKTRRGHDAYLKARDLSDEAFPLGSAALARHLLAATGTVCESLPPMALTPANMSGDWSFNTRCGPNGRNANKRFSGAFRLRHAGGGRYTGRIRMSNGIIGDISANLQGRSVTAVMNWGLLIGKTTMRGSVADEALVIYGRDDDRCRITARKR